MSDVAFLFLFAGFRCWESKLCCRFHSTFRPWLIDAISHALYDWLNKFVGLIFVLERSRLFPIEERPQIVVEIVRLAVSLDFFLTFGKIVAVLVEIQLSGFQLGAS